MKRTKRPETPVFDAYKQQPDLCDEILRWTGVRWLPNGKMRFEDMHQREPAADVHHIMGRGKYGDVWSNLIGVNAFGHHERHHGTKGLQNEFTTLCLLAKFYKQQIKLAPFRDVLRDWEYNELRLAHGKNLLPIIEAAQFEDEFIEAARRNLRAVIADIEQGGGE